MRKKHASLCKIEKERKLDSIKIGWSYFQNCRKLSMLNAVIFPSKNRTKQKTIKLNIGGNNTGKFIFEALVITWDKIISNALPPSGKLSLYLK